jgi:hypothetical protein
MLKTKSMKQTQALNSSSSLKKSSSLINILPDYIIENFIFYKERDFYYNSRSFPGIA